MNTLFKWLIPIVSAAAVSTAVYFGVTSGSGAVETAPAATSPSSGSTVSDAPIKPVVKKEITEWDVLDVTGSNAKTYEDGTVGKTYSHYLIDPFKNEDLWKQNFATYSEDVGKQSNFDSSFNNAVLQNAFDKDTSDDSSTYLNKVCRDAYKIKTSEDKWKNNDNDGSNVLKKNVWKYCSLIDHEPKLIKDIQSDDQYKEKTLGKEGKDDLVSVKDASNDQFWKVKNKWFTALSPKPTEEGFKDKTDVKEACKAAYDKQANGAPTLDVVKKYCSFVETNQPQQ